MARVFAAALLTSVSCASSPTTSAPTGSTPSAAIAGAREVGAVRANGTIVHDLRYTSGGKDVVAYLVDPAGGRTGPAVVFMHWLGSERSNRNEFLDEAKALASQGVTSLLVQGVFPWSDQPSGIDHDRAAIASEIASLKAGVDLLLAQPGIDPARLGFVGHDYGAMHGIGLLAADHRVRAAVLMAPDARYVDWFAAYWHFIKSDADQQAYAAQMQSMDPITVIKSATAPILFQFARNDEFLPVARADELQAVVPARSKQVNWYDASHELDQTARDDRDQWLMRELATT